MLIEVFKNKHNQHYFFRLCDVDGDIFATSIAYDTKEEAMENAKIVKAQAGGCEIWDLQAVVIKRIKVDA